MQTITRKFVVTGLAALALLSASAAQAEMYPPPSPADPAQVTRNASPESIFLDAVVLRPLGLIATAIGAATFVIALPFSIPTNTTHEAAQVLVGEPADYTFSRPLGDVDRR